MQATINQEKKLRRKLHIGLHLEVAMRPVATQEPGEAAAPLARAYHRQQLEHRIGQERDANYRRAKLG